MTIRPVAAAVLAAVALTTVPAAAAQAVVVDRSAATASIGAGETAAKPAVRTVAPAEFAARMKATKGPLINVHTPNEGEIVGTDHHIAWDRIAGDKRLPKKRGAEILIYCRSGTMSAAAARTLAEQGYTRIVELAGGYNAWRAEGRPFTQPTHRH
ncbi:MAG: rhodanese-like domain-containing protein [Sporichthyaceae bacterium]